MSNPHLRNLYTRENALQAINATAAKIEKETGIEVIRCHLGNPLGPQFEASNQVAADYYKTRSQTPTSRGYADVVGPANIRQVIANALTRINRLPPGSINKDNIRGITGGTGALNVAMSIFDDPTVLVSDPFYPPWMEVADHTQRRIETFNLRQQDDHLLNREIIEKTINDVDALHPGKPIVLIYHYPHNPTGKTLTEAEAKATAHTLNALCAAHPNLYLVQEDLYLATTASDMGIYTPLAHLDDNAKKHTMWLVSPSKMGHAQDRGAIIAAFDKELLHHLRGAVSFDMLGPTHPSLLITANTLVEIADGGLEPFGAAGSRPDNFRYKVADYYQDRIKIVADGISDIEAKLGTKMLDSAPKGAYYLYPSFEFLQGKEIPKELLPVFGSKIIFENADDVALALQNAHLIGLQPVTVASGSLFTDKTDTMHVRIATVEQGINKMHGLVNTLRGLAQKVTGVDLKAEFHKKDCLKEHHPVNHEANGAIPVTLNVNGKERPGFSIRY
jgi:aspartate/methionine/tyrosine aminotransferase